MIVNFERGAPQIHVKLLLQAGPLAFQLLQVLLHVFLSECSAKVAICILEVVSAARDHERIIQILLVTLVIFNEVFDADLVVEVVAELSKLAGSHGVISRLQHVYLDFLARTRFTVTGVTALEVVHGPLSLRRLTLLLSLIFFGARELFKYLLIILCALDLLLNLFLLRVLFDDRYGAVRRPTAASAQVGEELAQNIKQDHDQRDDDEEQRVRMIEARHQRQGGRTAEGAIVEHFV